MFTSNAQILVLHFIVPYVKNGLSRGRQCNVLYSASNIALYLILLRLQVALHHLQKCVHDNE